jgi:hypothetical protein
VTDSRSFLSDPKGKLREYYISDTIGRYDKAVLILPRFGSSLEYIDFVESIVEEKMKDREGSLW